MIDTDEGPTPETAAKLAAMDTDPMKTLWHNGELTVYQYEATKAIHNAFRIITGPLDTAKSDYGRPIGDAVYRVCWRNIGPLATNPVVIHYNTWASAMDAHHMPIGPVIDAVMDGHVEAVAPLRKALQLYAALAGWVNGRRTG